MRNLFHITLLLALLALLSAGGNGQQPAIFTCRIPEARHYNNLERIPLEVRMKSSDVDVDLAAVNPVPMPNFQSGVPYLQILANQVSGKEKKPVSIKLSKIAEGRDLDESYVRFLLEIPIDQAEKKQKIYKHLDDVAQEAKAKKNADPKAIALYENKNSREALANTFDRMYLQNRVGVFEINCRYSANSPQQSALIESRPTQVIIDFKSDFLDQPNFR
jgi:hypothetical protein